MPISFVTRSNGDQIHKRSELAVFGPSRQILPLFARGNHSFTYQSSSATCVPSSQLQAVVFGNTLIEQAFECQVRAELEAPERENPRPHDTFIVFYQSLS